MDPTWIALAGAVFGGAGLKVVEHWLAKDRVKIDDAAGIRNELRADLLAQRAQVAELEAAVDKWREEYYDLREQYTNVVTRLTMLTGEVPPGGDYIDTS